MHLLTVWKLEVGDDMSAGNAEVSSPLAIFSLSLWESLFLSSGGPVPVTHVTRFISVSKCRFILRYQEIGVRRVDV